MKSLMIVGKPVGSHENILTPVTLFGVIVPWTKLLNDGRTSAYKLVCSSGVEFFVVADAEWKQVLSQYLWEDVKVKGLLNVLNMSLIPQKVFPKGPTGERSNVIDINSKERRTSKGSQALLGFLASVARGVDFTSSRKT